jgi:hypothetical protein
MPISDDDALSAYIFAVQSEAHAQHCARTSTSFQDEFERRYKAWRNANAAALSKGESIARAQGAVGDKPPSIQAFAKMTAGMLDSLPEDDRQRRCDELLQMLLPKKGP